MKSRKTPSAHRAHRTAWFVILTMSCLYTIAGNVVSAQARPDENCVVFYKNKTKKKHNSKIEKQDDAKIKKEQTTCNLSYKNAEHLLDTGQTQVRVVLTKGGCYSWRANVFSTRSPYVQLYAPEDMSTVKHQIDYAPHRPDVPDTPAGRCKHIEAVTFIFDGNVEWIRLFAEPSSEEAPALSDTLDAGTASSSRPKRFVQKLQTITESPGATNVQVGWSPSFNGPQKVGVYSNDEYLLNIPNKYQNSNQWIGISSLIDRDNRGAQNPNSTINTLTYMAFLPTPKHPCKSDERGETLTKESKGDLYDCRGFKIRPAIVTVKSGAEYALDSGALNQINSIGVRVPFAFGSVSYFTMSPTVGFEAGRNFATDAKLPVSTGVFRWLAGTDASFRFPVPFKWLLGTKPYTLSGTFRARFPRTSEEFSTVYNSMTQYTTDRRTRLYGRATLSVPLSKILAVSVLYQYGDLPPAFLFFGHTLSISLTATSPTDYEH